MCQFLFFMLPLTKQHIVPCLQTGDYSRRGQQGASNHWATKVAGARQRVKMHFDVLQSLFCGLTGFTIPFAYFPTDQANSSDLYLTMWDSMCSLQNREFGVAYISPEDSSNNRVFVVMHFDGDPMDDKMLLINRTMPPQKKILPDPSQVIKNKTQYIQKCFSPDIHHNATNTQTGNSGKMLTYGANIEQSIALHPIPSKAAIAYSSRNLQKWEMPLQWKPWMIICCILCRHIKNFSILKKQRLCLVLLNSWEKNFGDYKKYDRQMVH